LVYQWKNRLLEFTNLNEDDISVLTSKNFLKDLEKPIIISTVQTFLSLIKRKYEEFIISLYKANIGISISDEVHTSVGAPTFSECSLYIPCLRNYGLSATPYRSDGNSDIINFHLGKTFSENDTSGTMPCKIYFVLFKCGVDLPNKKRYFYFAGTFQKSRYLNGIAKSEVLINLCTQILKRTYSDNRNIILVSERIKFLDEMMKIQDISEEDKGKFIAGSKNDILKKKIVFSTPGKIRDGVDIPEKDCLIMTSPISNISQIAGRVTRIYKDKKMPIIFDMVDIGSPPIRKTMLKRNDFYNEKGWEVKYILIGDNGEKSEISRNEAIKLI
jgi:superfamily II DNA or RNA helicase